MNNCQEVYSRWRKRNKCRSLSLSGINDFILFACILSAVGWWEVGKKLTVDKRPSSAYNLDESCCVTDSYQLETCNRTT